MANNLRKFQTEEDYTAATLTYPAVSWVVSGDTVHFDKTAPTPPTPPTPTGNTWVIYHSGDTIPSGTYGGLRISSTTTIGEGSSIQFSFDEGLSNITVGNIICVNQQCTEYCCNEWDEETGECIDWDWNNCCGTEECSSVENGYSIYYDDTGTTDEAEFTFRDGYWTFGGYEIYTNGQTNIPFDIELLVTQS